MAGRPPLLFLGRLFEGFTQNDWTFASISLVAFQLYFAFHLLSLGHPVATLLHKPRARRLRPRKDSDKPFMAVENSVFKLTMDASKAVKRRSVSHFGPPPLAEPFGQHWGFYSSP